MSPSSPSAELVERARDPGASLSVQHAAFTELVRRTQHSVFALAFSRLGDVEDARDAAQEAYATAWRRLGQLRDSAAFEPWLRSVVARECARRRRRRAPPAGCVGEACAGPDDGRLDYQAIVAAELDRLSEADREVVVLFYFLGYSLAQVGERLRLRPGTVAKRLHAARLRIRRGLPRAVRRDFVRCVPTTAFTERVRRGLLDDYVGWYRFDQRPDHVIRIFREEDRLISEGAGQRHLVASASEDSLLACHYDGEARFRRDRQGRVSSFVYYEFGRRMGVARRIRGAA